MFTNSAYAKRIQATLADQPFVKVMPRDYKRVMLAEAKARAENREPEFAELVGSAVSRRSEDQEIRRILLVC